MPSTPSQVASHDRPDLIAISSRTIAHCLSWSSNVATRFSSASNIVMESWPDVTFAQHKFERALTWQGQYPIQHFICFRAVVKYWKGQHLVILCPPPCFFYFLLKSFIWGFSQTEPFWSSLEDTISISRFMVLGLVFSFFMFFAILQTLDRSEFICFFILTLRGVIGTSWILGDLLVAGLSWWARPPWGLPVVMSPGAPLGNDEGSPAR